MRSDPEFAQAVQNAEEEATSSLVAEAFRRARDGTRRTIYGRDGEPKGEYTEYSDFLLKFLIECRDRNYNPKRQIELSGHLSSSNAHFVLQPSDLLLLPDKMLDQLTNIMTFLAENRPAEPAALPGPDHGAD